MKIRRLICLLLALALLTGCHSAVTLPELSADRPVAESEPADEPSAAAAEDAPQALLNPDQRFLFTTAAHQVVVRGDGQVLLDTTDQSLTTRTDGRSGALLGFMAERYEGVTRDENGWPQAEQVSTLIYDLDCQLLEEVPDEYPEYYGDLVFYPREGRRYYRLCRRSTGQVLYDNVANFDLLGDNYYLTLDDANSSVLILSADGQLIAQPSADYDDCYQFWFPGSRYLRVQQGELCGALDENGREVLPCQYTELTSCAQGYAVAQLDGQYQVIQLETGEVLFQWPKPILLAMPESLVITSDDQYEDAVLVDYAGNPLTDRVFERISVSRWDKNGLPTLLCGKNTGDVGVSEESVYFRPDGFLLPEDSPLFCPVTLTTETDAASGLTTVTGYHPQTGQQLFQLSRNGLLYSTYFQDSEDGPCYLLLVCQNSQNRSRCLILDESGTVLLDDCRTIRYLHDGVVQCTKGFTSGLWKLGTGWIYRENDYANLNH